MMKKILWVTITSLSAFIILNSCGSPRPEDSNRVIILEKKTEPTPDWVNSGDIMTVKKKNGQKVLYLIVESTRPTLNKASADVKAEKSRLMASSIKELTSSEMVRAQEGMLNDEGEMDSYYSEIVASISRNIDTSGLVIDDTYWEKLKIKQNSGYVEAYRVVHRYFMPYEVFQSRLIGEVTKEEPRINEKLKQKSEVFIKKMEKQLEKLGE